MGDLPATQVNPAGPISNVGIDFAGPLLIRDEGSKYGSKKAYICVFSCTVVRAIHLELVPDQTIEMKTCAFLKHLFSGRNWEAVKRHLASEGVEWIFITERAPWCGGGYWERLVQSVKTALKATLGQCLVSPDELRIVLCKVEAFVNDCLLTFVGSDVQEEIALTPAQFLIDRSLTAFPDRSDRASRGALAVVCVTCSAAGPISGSSSIFSGSEEPRVSDVVLVADYSTPRRPCPLGQIVDFFTGQGVGKVCKGQDRGRYLAQIGSHFGSAGTNFKSKCPRSNEKVNKESESEIADNPNFNMMNSRLSNFYKTNAASSTNTDTPLNIGSNQKKFNQHSSKGKHARKRKLREDTKRNSPEMPDNFNVFEDMIEIKRPKITFHDIGGCEHQLTEVCKFMFHMMHPEVYEKLGIRPPRGFLLYGPPGCGKTLLAHAIAGEFELPLIKITATEIVSGISGDSEKKIRNLFTKAILTAPCILFIDEIDAITPRRDVAQRDMDRRIVSQLLACIDDLENSDNHVLFIGATNRAESMDPALRMAGRFDREIAFGMPDELSRIKILEVVCRGVNLSGCFDFGHLARLCPGFVGADLKALVREACICSIKRVFTSVLNDGQSCNDERTIVSDTNNLPSNVSTAGSSWKINSELKNLVDWLKSGRQCSESALSFATVPDVTWNDVGALDSVREELQWSILYPVKWNREFSLMGLGGRAQGILLFGPPGCGKTLLAKAIANESGINFISVKGPELLNMYVGESERAVRQVFQRAKCSAPCVIFFDEIDALCPRRAQSDSSGVARLVNQLLTEMDGIECRREVFIMAATNRPDIIDPAVLRPGRLDKALYVGLPNELDRVSILRAITKNGTTPPMHEEIDFKQLSKDKRCEAFSGADLQHLVREASVEALREYFIIQNDQTTAQKSAIPELVVRLKHLDTALSKVKPSISVKEAEEYRRIAKMYKSSSQ
ncbi:Nuclear valosin-containing protein-like [Trichinella pseudospiralis]|uniref:Nuclear valosin-containing protein-like n=1 Tax=Trichinella pseudospiralis TaxID=6337 RepID=A0A0V1JD72_TRIPS|nr:Nuclear valosin-containing protein-like [Trichinella pseudospiralis]